MKSISLSKTAIEMTKVVEQRVCSFLSIIAQEYHLSEDDLKEKWITFDVETPIQKKKSSTSTSGNSKTLSPWILFCQQTRPTIKQENPHASSHDVMRIMGKMWRDMSKEQKQEFVQSLTSGSSSPSPSPSPSPSTSTSLHDDNDDDDDDNNDQLPCVPPPVPSLDVPISNVMSMSKVEKEETEKEMTATPTTKKIPKTKKASKSKKSSKSSQKQQAPKVTTTVIKDPPEPIKNMSTEELWKLTPKEFFSHEYKFQLTLKQIRCMNPDTLYHIIQVKKLSGYLQYQGKQKKGHEYDHEYATTHRLAPNDPYRDMLYQTISDWYGLENPNPPKPDDEEDTIVYSDFEEEEVQYFKLHPPPSQQTMKDEENEDDDHSVSSISSLEED